MLPRAVRIKPRNNQRAIVGIVRLDSVPAAAMRDACIPAGRVPFGLRVVVVHAELESSCKSALATLLIVLIENYSLALKPPKTVVGKIARGTKKGGRSGPTRTIFFLPRSGE